MRQYLDLLRDVLTNGVPSEDRTGVGTFRVFGRQLRFNLGEGFPLVTTKRVYWKGVVHELLWFLSGSTNIRYLQGNDVHIWDEWADKDGNLGPVYGEQWRSWPDYHPGDGSIDQIEQAILTLRNNPDDRGIIVSSWNVPLIPEMALRPCHVMFQFASREMTDTELLLHYNAYSGDEVEGRPPRSILLELMKRENLPTRLLSCQLYQRSADLFLGVPFNIASYALLTHMVAQCSNHWAHEFIHTFGDAHIYKNHVDQVKLQIGRIPAQLPVLELTSDIGWIDGFTYDDIKLLDYYPDRAIPAPVAV